MRAHALLALLPVIGTQAVRIIQSNDDGWAELNVRTLHDALNGAGYDVVLSGPAENKSGTSSRDEEPKPRSSACQYDSCLAGSGPVGTNATNPRLNWVNSFPVTSIRYGIDTFGPQIWNGAGPDLAVTGPNVGHNLYLSVPFSGTVGAAVYAAKEAGIPAIAFSGSSAGGATAWNKTPVPRQSLVYAELAEKLTSAVVNSGKPYLPEDVWLNVNFPEVTDECLDASAFKFVLSRINLGVFSEKDVTHCGEDRLPAELEVVSTEGCYVSVSVGDANDKTTAPADKQAVVLEKLGDLFTCLP
ncbi:related to acid phosphatase precursor [Cephalotrichum gorgonifer]|uniref:Related to acid phosphatase n=1 Tax=Cephalotrichum gorgonifer TaxID=2041049 RepID=A0AAE8N504_9PEZI|nr:related to acid phosphatase precursor [Cephalotrichum gorgonifer]